VSVDQTPSLEVPLSGVWLAKLL